MVAAPAEAFAARGHARNRIGRCGNRRNCRRVEGEFRGRVSVGM